MVVWIVVWIVPSVDGRDVLTFDVTGEPCEFQLMVSLRDDARGGFCFSLLGAGVYGRLIEL
jgi:hypothetical protein